MSIYSPYIYQPSFLNEENVEIEYDMNNVSSISEMDWKSIIRNLDNKSQTLGNLIEKRRSILAGNGSSHFLQRPSTIRHLTKNGLPESIDKLTKKRNTVLGLLQKAVSHYSNKETDNAGGYGLRGPFSPAGLNRRPGDTRYDRN